MKKEQIIKNLKELRDTIYVTYSNTVDSINSKRVDFTTTINNMERNTQEVLGLKELLSKTYYSGSVPKFMLGGFLTADIVEKNGVNYLELVYKDGKARISCAKNEEKTLFPTYRYHINRKFNGENGLVTYRYNSKDERADYNMCLRDDNGISNIKGEIKANKKTLQYVDGKSKVYTFDTLDKLKPLYNFKNDNIAVISNVVGNFRPQYLPSYEDSYVSEVIGERAYCKYNGVSNSDLLKDYESDLGMIVGFDSYIFGDMRPSDALVKKLK